MKAKRRVPGEVSAETVSAGPTVNATGSALPAALLEDLSEMMDAGQLYTRPLESRRLDQALLVNLARVWRDQAKAREQLLADAEAAVAVLRIPVVKGAPPDPARARQATRLAEVALEHARLLLARSAAVTQDYEAAGVLTRQGPLRWDPIEIAFGADDLGGLRGLASALLQWGTSHHSQTYCDALGKLPSPAKTSTPPVGTNPSPSLGARPPTKPARGAGSGDWTDYFDHQTIRIPNLIAPEDEVAIGRQRDSAYAASVRTVRQIESTHMVRLMDWARVPPKPAAPAPALPAPATAGTVSTFDGAPSPDKTNSE